MGISDCLDPILFILGVAPQPAVSLQRIKAGARDAETVTFLWILRTGRWAKLGGSQMLEDNHAQSINSDGCSQGNCLPLHWALVLTLMKLPWTPGQESFTGMRINHGY